MFAYLLSSTYACPAQWLIVNGFGQDSLCNYFGLKFDDEYMEMLINARLAYKNDNDYSFNWNKSSKDGSKYSWNQLIIEYRLPVELSEMTRLKKHKGAKLRYMRIGSFSPHYLQRFNASQQFNVTNPIEIKSIRQLKNEMYATSKPIIKEVLIKIRESKDDYESDTDSELDSSND